MRSSELTSQEAAPLQLHVFGNVRLLEGAGTDRTPKSRKARALLVFLALRASGRASREEVASLLWSGASRDRAFISLRQTLREIRAALGELADDVLQATRLDLRLDARRCPVDAHLLRETAHPEWVSRAIAIDGPLGEGLEDCDPVFGEWLMAERAARWNEIASAAAKHLREDAMIRDASLRVPLANTVLRMDPTDEHAQRALRASELAHGRVAVVGGAPESPRPGAADGTPSVEVTSHGEPTAVLADMALEVAESLARYRWLAVLDPSQAWRSERRHAPRYTVRISGVERPSATIFRLRLLRPDSGRLLWGESLRCTHWDAAPQEVQGAAAMLAAQIELEETRTAGREEVSGPEGLLLRSLPPFYSMTREGLGRAASLLLAAEQLDPAHARARAQSALTRVFLVGQGFADDTATAKAKAIEDAARATELAPDDGLAWAIRGHVESFLAGDPQRGLDWIDRGVRLAPSVPLTWALSAVNLTYVGHHERALSHAMRIPNDEGMPASTLIGLSRCIAFAANGHYEAAARLGRRLVAESPTLTACLVPLLVSLGHLERHTEAAHYRGALMQRMPEASIEKLAGIYRLVRESPEYAGGLRAAGIPAR